MRVAILLTVLVLAGSLAPAGTATHWTMYHAGIERSVGETHEDDQQVFHAPGNPYHLTANKVHAPGTAIGDGSLFLDARLSTVAGFPGNSEGISSEGISFFTGGLGEALLHRPDLLLPGDHQVSAWYGWWNDLDQDGFIEDYHDDGACTPADPGCDGRDEFKWRGLGSGESVAVVLQARYGHGEPLTDGTSRSRSEQGWFTDFYHSPDEPLLATMYTMVVAGAAPAPGTLLGYDVNDPAALIDVDRYAAVSPEVESLWASGVNDAFDIADPLLDAAFDAADTALNLVDVGQPLNTVYGLYPAITELSSTVIDTAGLRDEVDRASDFQRMFFNAPWSKEPNHVLDDYGGRALFGGIGDHLGSYNTYTAYAESHHLYFDAWPMTIVCAGVYAAVPGTQVSATPYSQCEDGLGYADVDPVGATVRTARDEGPLDNHGSGAILTFRARVLLWKDLNLDTHVGTVCDNGNSIHFDAERNTCRHAGRDPQNDHSSNPERVRVCDNVDARTRPITLTPIGGPWPNVVVIRDYRETTRAVYGSPPEVVSGSEPIQLRWSAPCDGIPPDMDAQDAIMFPTGGTTIPIRVDTHAGLPAFRDDSLGIHVTDEHVHDVDILPASL